tara:strand:- start:91 stop:492 length:402 start_codon:yes stop_codon:yes gene_type:complete
MINFYNRAFGPLVKHKKNCVKCDKEYIIEARVKTKRYKNSKYCSRSCANNRQEWWNNNLKSYRKIAFRTWPKECAICGFDKIVAVHHIDEDKKNNNVKNLIPLCPNHHEMVHSKYANEILPKIKGLLVKRDHG